MEKKIVIFGCGGHARSIINALLRNHKGAQILLIDENAEADEYVMGCKVQRDYEVKEADEYIIAVGDNGRRRKIYDYLKNNFQGKCVPVISDLACIGIKAYIGSGTFIAPYAYIGPQAKIGCNTIINTGSVVEHEVIIGNHTHIAPHATICGRTRIGNGVFCGAGSTVIDNICICDNVIIGAGAAVVSDIAETGTYVGVPARKVRKS